MSESGYLNQDHARPTSLAIVIALHAAAISALALSKMEMPEAIRFGPIETYNVPIKPPPPSDERKPDEQKPKVRQQAVTRVAPIVEPPVRATDETIAIDLPLPPRVDELDGPRVEPTPLPPIAADPPKPVQKEAQLDSRSELQPPYPASEERAGTEGTVRIRILIGADGRVKSAEKVSATSDAFYRATERHALRNWRFRPATLDGRPVESWRTMSVRFLLRR